MDEGGHKKRSQNWVHEDKVLLQELVRERVAAIENKNTNTNTNKSKKDAWDSLLQSFNSMCKGNQRTVPQLKTQWGILKLNAKKAKAEYRKEVLKTGGGPQPLAPQETFDDISSWLPNEFFIDSNEFDSDRRLQTAETIPMECIEQCEVQVLTSPILAESIQDEEVILITSTQPQIAGQEEPQPPNRAGKKRKKFSKQNSDDAARMSINALTKLDLRNRKELHKLKLINERKRSRNLDMEYRLIKEKLKLCRSSNKNHC